MSRFGTTGTQGGFHGRYTPGHWRADPPSGTPLPEPEKPERADHVPVSVQDNRTRDQRTAENLAARSASLAPRRWRPGQ